VKAENENPPVLASMKLCTKIFDTGKMKKRKKKAMHNAVITDQ
jgi:hypothetical protein